MPTITIELSAAQATRLSDAWTTHFGATPTMQDVREHLVRELKAIVYHGEKKAAEAQFSPPPFDPT